MSDKWQSFGLADKVAIVTGASQGIGRTLAVALAEAGVHVALVSRTQAALDEVATEVRAHGRQALVVPTDLTEVTQIRAMVKKVHADFGRIDILINNAAWTATVEALKVTEEQWEAAIAGALQAPLRLIRAALPHLKAGSDPAILVNLSSSVRELYRSGQFGLAQHYLDRLNYLYGTNNPSEPMLDYSQPLDIFVRKQLEGEIEMLTGKGLEIGGLVDPGVAVPVPTPFLDNALHIVFRESTGSLEVHVLDPVGDPGEARALVPAADAVPAPDAHEGIVAHRAEEDGEAVVQNLATDEGAIRNGARAHPRCHGIPSRGPGGTPCSLGEDPGAWALARADTRDPQERASSGGAVRGPVGGWGPGAPGDE